MGQGYRRAPGDSVEPIVAAQKALADRADRLESPTGTSLSKLVAQVKAAIVGITAQVNIAVAAALAAGISTPGNITSTGGSVSAAGNVNANGDLHGVNIYATAAPSYNITGGRVTAWWETATGRGGFTASSERFKTNIEPVERERMLRLMAVGIIHFEYTAETRKRDDPTYEGYVGPDYHVGTNIGSLAEALHREGLWEFVVYERTVITETRHELDETGEDVEVEVPVGEELKLGEDGEPIPLGIHEVLLPYALIVVAQDHDERIAAIEAHLGIGSNS